MHIIKSRTTFSFTSSFTNICSEWKPFHELLPVLKNRAISLLSHGKVFLGLFSEVYFSMRLRYGHYEETRPCNISWICNRPFSNLSKTFMIYFVKIVDRFSQNPLNLTFTKYGLVCK